MAPLQGITGGALMRPWPHRAPRLTINGIITFRTRINPGRHEWRHHVPHAYQPRAPLMAPLQGITGGALMRPWPQLAPPPALHHGGKGRRDVSYTHSSGRHKGRPWPGELHVTAFSIITDGDRGC